MLYKKFSIPFILLASSLGLLLLILKTPLAGIFYQNVLAHSFIMLAFSAVLFFSWFFSYQYYVKEKDINWYIITLVCFILVVFYFAHAVLIPSFGWGNEALFDISEHYGLFLASLVLWGLVISFSDKIKEKIYLARTKIFLGMNLLLLVGFALLFILSPLANALFGSVNIFIGLTGISFFFLTLILLTRKEQNFFTTLFPMPLAFGVTISIVPFFYQEWNFIWWFFHLLLLSGALLLLLLLLRAKKEIGITEILFSSFSIRARLFFIIGLTLAAIVVNGLIDFRLSRNHLQTQTMDNLVLMADMQEGQVLNWLDKLKDRTVDFSSDGFIRLELNKILSGDPQAVADLNRHLLENKKSLDPTIFGIHIMDTNGKVVASSRGSEVGGEDMAMEEIFIQARGTRYADAFLSDIVEEIHFGEKNIAILATAPIIDQTKLENIGVIMLFFKAQGLSDILRGRAQTQVGALSTWTTRTKTMEMYLVNEDKLMISESRFIVNAAMKQKVDTVPVRLCDRSEEMSGEYLDYRQIPVFGASMCFPNGWTLLTEIDKDEVLASLDDYLQQNLLSGAALLLLILLAMYLFSIGIITPLKELSAVAQKLGKGDFTARAKLATRDEFGELAQAFNSMVESIQKGNASLEEKVKEEETNRLAIGNILGDLEEEKKKALNFARDLEKFKMAAESTSDMVVISDPEGIALYANPATEKITGYTVQETIGKKCGLLWGGHMEPAYYKQMWQTIKVAKKAFVSKIKNKRKNGEFYTASIAISPVLDQKGNILFLVDTSRDITREVEIDKAKTEFVSLASHQLRTPLSTINWYTEMLLSGDAGVVNENQKKYLEEAYNASKRMVELVNSLLNVSRLEMGTFIVEPEPTDVMTLAKSVVDELKLLADQKKISLKLSCVDNLPKIQADPKLLRMVLSNLLSNSVKYTPEKGEVKMDLSLVKAGGKVGNKQVPGDSLLCTVADTGYGIPKPQQDKIFTKLFRADNVREKDAEGTGLGLYIVKSIIDHSGGMIWFESVENKPASPKTASRGGGSTFYVILPLEGMKKKEGTKALA